MANRNAASVSCKRPNGKRSSKLRLQSRDGCGHAPAGSLCPGDHPKKRRVVRNPKLVEIRCGNAHQLKLALEGALRTLGITHAIQSSIQPRERKGAKYWLQRVANCLLK